MKRKLMVFSLLLCLILTGCGSSEKENVTQPDTQQINQNINNEISTEEITSSNETVIVEEIQDETWDGIITLDGCSFKIGDSVSVVFDQGWNGYVCGKGLDFTMDTTYQTIVDEKTEEFVTERGYSKTFDAQNVYVLPSIRGSSEYEIELYFEQLNHMVSHVWVINPYPYACPIKDCIIYDVSLGTVDAKEVFPEIRDKKLEEDGDRIFGKNRKTTPKFEDYYAYDYGDFTISLDSMQGRFDSEEVIGNLDKILIKWNKTLAEDFYYDTTDTSDLYNNGVINYLEYLRPSFLMGNNTCTFTDETKILKPTFTFLENTQYLTELLILNTMERFMA